MSPREQDRAASEERRRSAGARSWTARAADRGKMRAGGLGASDGAHGRGHAGTQSFRFTAVVERMGRNPCVMVPVRVSASLGRRGPVRVQGTLDGTPVRSTLMPAGDGRHQLYLNAAMRAAAGVEVGDRVRLVLREDAEEEQIALPPDLARALGGAPRARAAFDALPAARRNELVGWVLAARRHDTREQRARCMLDVLLGRRRG